MSERIGKILKDKLRSLNSDLADWNMNLKARTEAAAEAEQMVEFLKEQIVTIQSQLDKLEKEG